MEMSLEYIVGLHDFMHKSDDSNKSNLINRVLQHMCFIPNGTLYRYRPCLDRELIALRNDRIWIADPQKYPDAFDSTLPFNRGSLLFDCPLYLVAEVFCRVLEGALQEGDPFIDKQTIIENVKRIIMTYTPEEIHEKSLAILGERKTMDPSADLTPVCAGILDAFDSLFDSPRRILGIACFTTDYNNRAMWENYAGRYTGFCVEYKFPDTAGAVSPKSAWDVLHLLPVSYYKSVPLFDYSELLNEIVDSVVTSHEYDFRMFGDSFLAQYYQSILAKDSAYSPEKEWRLILSAGEQGLYPFPYVSRIIAGKDISKEDFEELRRTASALGVPFYMQYTLPGHSDFLYDVVD